MKVKDLELYSKMGAGCLLISKNTNQFLLIRRSDYVSAPNVWCIPGGKVDEGETPEFAAKRELYEEAGFLTDLPFELIYTNEVHAPRFKFYTYACVIPKEIEPKLNWESSDYLWCDMSSLPHPLHWGLSQLFASDNAGKRLKRFLEQQKSIDR
jgi:8-oxo-dGTP pyrophosphatase MutT (NUDIX family)